MLSHLYNESVNNVANFIRFVWEINELIKERVRSKESVRRHQLLQLHNERREKVKQIGSSQSQSKIPV